MHEFPVPARSRAPRSKANVRKSSVDDVIRANNPKVATIIVLLLLWCLGDIFIWIVTPLYFVGNSAFDAIQEQMGPKIAFFAACYCATLFIGWKYFRAIWAIGESSDTLRTPHMLALICIVFIVTYNIAFLLLGGLTWRETYGNLITGSQLIYYLRALEGVPLIACMVLVCRGHRVPILAGIIVASYVGLQLLGSNRGIAFAALVAMGLMRLDLLRRHWRAASVFGFAAFLVFTAIGVQREWRAAGGSGLVQTQYLSGAAVNSTMFRLSEYYGHIVFNRSSNEGFVREPFRNFDRIPLAFVPAVAASSKRPLDDGPETLRTQFGFVNVGTFLSIPITLVGDTYLRFGFWGSFVYALYIGGILILWTAIAGRFSGGWMSLILIYVFVHLIRLYPNSFLGAINFLIYKPARDLLLFGLLGLAAAACVRLRRS